MKKISFSKIFSLFLSALLLVTLCATLGFKINAENITTYETPDYISISDLTQNGKYVGNKIIMTKHSTYSYQKSATYNSVEFSFKFKNTNWTSDSDGVQIHLFSTWQSDGAFWLRPDANRIMYKVNDQQKYVTGNTIYAGEHDIKLGRLAIFNNGSYTGNYYFYIDVDNVRVAEFVKENMSASSLSDNNIFLTGSNGNTLIDSNWTGNSITFISNKTIIDSYKTSENYLTKPTTDPELPGKTFVGWFDSLGSEWDFENNIVTSDLTLTAGFVTSEAQTSDEEYFNDNTFTPVLRFLVSSDTHIGQSTSERDARLASEFEVAYSYAENSTTYNNLDAALFAGDLSDDGSKSALNNWKAIVDACIEDGTAIIVSMGNHEFRTYDSVTHEMMVFEEATGKEWDSHVIINGFHFIALSPNLNEGYNFSETKINWLEEQLEIAANDTPNKPIFVIQHENVQGTVYGSESWGMNELTEILCKYPQVVDFSGHSHYPLSDPRCIWQGTFTALSTGTLHYYEMGINGYKNSGVFPTDKSGGWSTSTSSVASTAEFQIVEVDANNAIRVIVYDLINEREITRYYMRNIMDDIKFTYSHQERKKDAEKPYFDNVELTAYANEDALTVEFDQATCDDIVESYRIELYKAGTLVRTEYALSDYFFYPVPERIKVNIRYLEENTTYTIKVYAVNVWGMCSVTPIETTAKTGKVTVYEDVVDEISLNDIYLGNGSVATTETLKGYQQVHFIPSENNMYGSFKLRMQLYYVGGDFQVTFNNPTTNADMVWINNGNNIWFIEENFKSPDPISPGLHIVEYGRYHITKGTKSYTVFYVMVDDKYKHEYKSTNKFTNDGYFSLNCSSSYAAGSRYYDIDYTVPKEDTPTYKKGENVVLSNPITNWIELGGLLTFDSKSSSLTVWLEDKNGRVTNDQVVKGVYKLGKNGDFYHYAIKTKSFDLAPGMTGYEQIIKFAFQETNFEMGNLNVTYYGEEEYDIYDEISILDVGLPSTDGFYSNAELEVGYSYYGTSPSYSGILRYYLICGDLDDQSEFRSQFGTLWSYNCSLWIQQGNENYAFFGFYYSTRSANSVAINLKSHTTYLVETATLLVTEGEWTGWKYTYLKIDGVTYFEFYAPVTECVSTSYQTSFKVEGGYKVADISFGRTVEYIVDGKTYSKVQAVNGSTIYEPTMPTKEGYYFTGWYTEETGGKRVDFNEVLNSNSENVKYYARFSDTQATVKFYSLGELIETQEVGISGCALKPATPIKTGDYKYIFVKWVIKGTNTEYDFSSEVYENIELEAIFEEYKYKIVYRVDGALYATRYYLESDPSTIIGSEPTIPGYVGSNSYWDYSVTSRTKGDIYAISRYNCVSTVETNDISLSKFNGKKVDIADELTRYYLNFADTNYQGSWLSTYPVSGGHEKQNISFSWTDNSSNTSYIVYFADNSGFTNAFVVKTIKKSITNVGIFEPGKTYYWKVVGATTGKQSAVDSFTVLNTPVRWISAGTVYNMRDLGGFITTNNKQVKYGMLFRGGQLALDQSGEKSYMNEYSYKVFDYLGIKTEIELRGDRPHDYNQFNDIEKVISINGQAYLSIFNMNEASKQEYRNIFKALADESNYPFYFHCSWGADRTGTLGFLLSGVLGVSYEGLVEDFELTSLSNSGRRLREDTGFDAMYIKMMELYDDGSGNFQKAITKYLTLYIGVKQSDIDAFRNLLLVDATEQAVTHTITYRVDGKDYLKATVFDGEYASEVAPVFFEKHFSYWTLNGEKYDINTKVTSDIVLDAVFEKTIYETYDVVTLRDLGLGDSWTPTETPPVAYTSCSVTGGRIFEFDYEIVSATGAFNDGVHIEMDSLMWQFKAHLWIADSGSEHVFTGGDGSPTVTSTKKLEYGKTYNIKFGVLIPINGPYAGKNMLIFMIDDEIICELECSSNILAKSIGLSGTQGILHSVDNKMNVTFIDADGKTVIKTKEVTRGALVEAIETPTALGKVFIGWFDSLGNEWNFEKDLLLKEETLYARFGDATVKALILDSNDFEIANGYKVKVGTKVSDIETPKVRKGLEFSGWYNGKTKLNDNDVITEDMNLICIFNVVENSNDIPTNPVEKGCKGIATISYSLISVLTLMGVLTLKKKKELN